MARIKSYGMKERKRREQWHVDHAIKVARAAAEREEPNGSISELLHAWLGIERNMRLDGLDLEFIIATRMLFARQWVETRVGNGTA